MIRRLLESHSSRSRRSVWKSTALYPSHSGGETPPVCDAFPHRLLHTYIEGGQVGGAETMGAQVGRPLPDVSEHLRDWLREHQVAEAAAEAEETSDTEDMERWDGEG